MIFASLVFVYFVGTIAYLFLAKAKRPFSYSDKFARDIPEINAEERAAAEKNLLEKPDDFMLRLSILKSLFAEHYSYKNPEPGMRHVRWLASNKPEYIAFPYCTTPFVMLENKEKIVEEMIVETLKKYNFSALVLRSAADFCTILNTELALDCAFKLLSAESLNPEVLNKIAILKKFIAGDDHENIEKWRESWKFFEVYIRWPWSNLDFWKLENLKDRFGKAWWPYPLSYAALYIKGRLSYGIFGYISHVTDLSEAGLVALNAHEFKKAKRIGKQVAKQLPQYESVCKWPPFLFDSYGFLTRLAIIDRNLDQINYYLKKRESYALDSEFGFGIARTVANHLLSAGYKELAVEHLKNLARDLPDNTGVKKYIDIIKSDRIIEHKTINEK
jgi:hypothetical protein